MALTASSGNVSYGVIITATDNYSQVFDNFTKKLEDIAKSTKAFARPIQSSLAGYAHSAKKILTTQEHAFKKASANFSKAMTRERVDYERQAKLMSNTHTNMMRIYTQGINSIPKSSSIIGNRLSGGAIRVPIQPQIDNTALTSLSEDFNSALRNAVSGGFASGAVNMFKPMIESAGEYEQLLISIKALSGSIAEGESFVKYLREFTVKSPLDFESTIKGAKMLLAYGLPFENIREDIEMLTGISAGVGVDKFKHIAYAYAQISAAGKLYSTEARQMSEAGVPIKKLISERRGWSMQQLEEFMKGGGAISADEVRSALESMVSEGGQFYGLLEKQRWSFKGIMSSMKDVAYFIKVDLGGALTGYLKPYLMQVSGILSKISDLAATAHGQSTFLAFFKVTAVVAAFAALSSLLGSFKLLTSFLLPTAIRQTYLLAIANNKWLSAAGMAFKSLAVSGFGVLLTMGKIYLVLSILDAILKSVFSANYLENFTKGLMGFFHLVDNFNAKSGTSAMNSETYDIMTQRQLDMAVDFFIIFKAIRAVVLGVVDGMSAMLKGVLSIFGKGEMSHGRGLSSWLGFDEQTFKNIGQILAYGYAMYKLGKFAMWAYRSFIAIRKGILGFINAQTKGWFSLYKLYTKNREIADRKFYSFKNIKRYGDGIKKFVGGAYKLVANTGKAIFKGAFGMTKDFISDSLAYTGAFMRKKFPALAKMTSSIFEGVKRLGIDSVSNLNRYASKVGERLEKWRMSMRQTMNTTTIWGRTMNMLTNTFIGKFVLIPILLIAAVTALGALIEKLTNSDNKLLQLMGFGGKMFTNPVGAAQDVLNSDWFKRWNNANTTSEGYERKDRMGKDYIISEPSYPTQPFQRPLQPYYLRNSPVIPSENKPSSEKPIYNLEIITNLDGKYFYKQMVQINEDTLKNSKGN